MRAGYGKGVAYAEIDGRGVIFLTSPGFFLHALDAKTGQPLENWGRPVPLPGFPRSGVVDLVDDLIQRLGALAEVGGQRARNTTLTWAFPRELGYITSSSPPIVVNGVVVVGNSAEQGYNQTRIENVPGDILATTPGPGSISGSSTSSRGPASSATKRGRTTRGRTRATSRRGRRCRLTHERGIVYIPTNPPTIDYFGGFRPGANLYGTSVIALDVKTGKRVWHFQTVHNDQWNYDLPNVPILAEPRY